MKNFFLLILLSSTLMLSCNGSKKTNTTNVVRGVDFKKSETLSAVLDIAAAKDKIVFLDFYTSWCLPCKMMDEDVFSDKKIANFFNDNFVSYKINAEKGNGVNLSYIYNIKAYPTIMFVDTKGHVIEQTEGAVYHTELMKMAERALASQN